jgi:hypothetical protein
LWTQRNSTAGLWLSLTAAGPFASSPGRG